MDPQISGRLTDLYGLLKRVEEEKRSTDQYLLTLNRMRDRQDFVDAKPTQRQKIKSLYKSTISGHELESKTLKQALDVVVDIRQTVRQSQKKLIATMNSNHQGGVRRGALMKILQQSASALPLFISDRLGDRAPPLCGCVPADPSYVAKSGDMIAAFVQSPDGDGSKVWVLGEVITYIHGAGKYEIDDIDDDIHNSKDRHNIGRRRVIPLPTMRANPDTNPEALFSKDTLVLALYPQTTCFYRAIVDRPPGDIKQDYMVSFEDPTYTEGYSPPLAVPQRYVITAREPKK